MMHPRSWAFFIYPIALSLFLGMGIFGAFLWWLMKIVEPLFSVKWPTHLADAPFTQIIQWIIDQFGEAAFSIALFVAMLLLTIHLFKWVQLIFLAPYMSYLSTRLADELTGGSTPFQWNWWLRDAARSVLIACLNFGMQIGCTMLVLGLQLLLTWWLPALLIITLPVSAIVNWMLSAYFTGAALMDLPLEAQHLSWRERWRRVHGSKLSAWLHGALFALLLALPFVGLWLAAVVSASAVAYTAQRKQWLNAQTTR